MALHLQKLGIEGLICVGGDGTLNGMQPLCDRLPVVLAPKTIDNDLGLNYASEPEEWVRSIDPASKGEFHYKRIASNVVFHPDRMINVSVKSDTIGTSRD